MKDSTTARRLAGSLDNFAALSAARTDEKELTTAFVLQLTAQAVLYTISCLTIVIACVSSSRRLRQLNVELEKRSSEVDFRASAVASAGAALIGPDSLHASLTAASSALRVKVR